MKSIMCKFFLGKHAGVQDETETRNESTGLLLDIIAFSALAEGHKLRIKIPAWIKWAKRYYLDVVCYSASLPSMTHKSEPAQLHLHRDSSKFKDKVKLPCSGKPGSTSEKKKWCICQFTYLFSCCWYEGKSSKKNLDCWDF